MPEFASLDEYGKLLESKQTLQEHKFTSDLPGIGAFIAKLRDLWNSVATKWYVRPLIHQQNQFNAVAVESLREFSRVTLDRIDEVDQRLIVLDQEHTALRHDVAELTAQIARLNRLLAETQVKDSTQVDTSHRKA